MLKTLGWVTVGIAAGVLLTMWRLGEDSAGIAESAASAAADAPSADIADGPRADRETAALTRRVAELEAEVQKLSGALDAVTAEQARSAERAQAENASPDSAVRRTPRAVDATAAQQDDRAADSGAEEAPRVFSDIDAVLGQTFVYRVTGATIGAVWGTDVYTDDSTIAAAAVHAGALQPGETGTVMLIVREGLSQYRGSQRFGVSSSDYGEWQRSYSLQRLY